MSQFKNLYHKSSIKDSTVIFFIRKCSICRNSYIVNFQQFTHKNSHFEIYVKYIYRRLQKAVTTNNPEFVIMFLRKNHKMICHITTIFKRFIHYEMVAKFTASFLVILNALLFHRNQCYRPTKKMTH